MILFLKPIENWKYNEYSVALRIYEGGWLIYFYFEFWDFRLFYWNSSSNVTGRQFIETTFSITLKEICALQVCQYQLCSIDWERKWFLRPFLKHSSPFNNKVEQNCRMPFLKCFYLISDLLKAKNALGNFHLC